jgi:hypothetical protein
MADKHPSGNPDLIEQHKKIQQKGDQELAGTAHTRPKHVSRKEPAHRKESPESDNSGAGSDGGSFVGP